MVWRAGMLPFGVVSSRSPSSLKVRVYDCADTPAVVTAFTAVSTSPTSAEP